MNCSNLRVCILVVFTSCFLGCYEQYKLFEVAEVRKVILLHDGRLLTSTNEGLYQTQSSQADEFSSVLVSRFNCDHQDLVQLRHYVFSLCNDLSGLGHTLLVADTRAKHLAFRLFMSLNAMSLPKHLAAHTNSDTLYIAHSFDALQDNIGRITFNFVDNGIYVNDFDPNWLGPEHGVYRVDRLRFSDDSLYFSDLDRIKKIDIINVDSGSQTSYTGSVIFNDFLPICNGFLINSAFQSKIFFVNDMDEIVFSNTLRHFSEVSSMVLGHDKFFSAQHLVIAEKNEPTIGIRSQLSVIDLSALSALLDCQTQG